MHLFFLLCVCVTLWGLSIPVPWDFSMHLFSSFFVSFRHHISISFNSRSLGFFHASPANGEVGSVSCTVLFQFPFLGIFPCIGYVDQLGYSSNKPLSIPVPWDFSMHPGCSLSTRRPCCGVAFQFPFLGIFPCISKFHYVCICSTYLTFNSRSLGFFHAS